MNEAVFILDTKNPKIHDFMLFLNKIFPSKKFRAEIENKKQFTIPRCSS